MNRFNTPSKNMEETLDDVVNAAEASLSAMDRAKRTARATADDREHYAESKRIFSPELYTQPIKRSLSAPRGAKNIVLPENYGEYEQKKDDGLIERRFESFLRKQKLMEERLKRIEQQKAMESHATQEAKSERDKLIEDQRADHKLIHNLRSQISTLKSKVDFLVQNAEQKSEHPAVLDSMQGPTNVQELVKAAVQAEMRVAVGEITTAIMPDQGRGQLGRSGQSQLTDTKIFARSAGVEQFTSMEKELIRMSGEVERMKTKQMVLESAYSELKNTASIREIKAEEAFKKSINAHRVEVETFLGSAARRTADSLATVQTHAQELAQLRSELDGFVDRSGNALAELDMKIGFLEQAKEEIYNVLERVEGDTIQLKNQTADAEASLVRFVEDSLRLTKVAGTVDSLSRQMKISQERLETMDIKLQTTASSVDAQSVPIDLLAKSIDGINEKFESRTDTLRQSIDAHKASADEVIANIEDGAKKTRGKVKELTESIKNVTKIRQSIDAVLQEVDNRAKQDASWTYSFKTALQKIDSRLQAVENALHPSSLGDSYQQALGSPLPPLPAEGSPIPAKRHTGTSSPVRSQGAVVQISTRPVPVLGTQFDEIRALMVELREQLSREQREGCDRIRRELATSFESSLGALEDRCTTAFDDRNKQTVEYVDSSIDLLTQSVQELNNAASEERSRRQDQDAAQNEQSSALRAQLTELDEQLSSIKSSVEVIEDAMSSNTETLTATVTLLKSKVLDLREEMLERFQSQEAAELRRAEETAAGTSQSTADLADLMVTLKTKIAEHENTSVESARQLKTHINLIDELHTSLEQCQTILEGHENRLNDTTETLLSHEAALTEATTVLNEKVDRGLNTASEQCGLLQDDLYVLKEDMSAHVRFTNDSLGDLQEAQDKALEVLNVALREQAVSLETLHTSHSHTSTTTSEREEQLRALIRDMDVKVTQGHTLLERSLTDLEHTLATGETATKSRLAGTEKRLASQEAAMKERVIKMEVKLGSLEESLHTQVASMVGSLASKEEELKESVPIQTKLAQDAALELRFAETHDALRGEILSVKERVSEVEGRMATHEADLGKVAAVVEDQLATYRVEMTKELTGEQVARATALSALSDDVLRTVDDRNAGIRELIFQIHELLTAQQEEFAQSTSQTAEQISGLEGSIASTDQLISEHVNSTQSALANIQEDLDLRVTAKALEDASIELKSAIAEACSSAGTTAVQDVAHKLSALEETCSKRWSEADFKVNAVQATATVNCAALESRIEAQEEMLENRLTEVTAGQNTEHDKVMGLLLNLEERMDTANAAHTESTQASEASLLGKINDISQLIQMQERRLRTTEKSIENKAQEVAGTTSELRALLMERLATITDSLSKQSASTLESTNTLTVQLVALQGQLNDHTDEVRDTINTEIAELKASVGVSDPAHVDHLSQRLEDWLRDLQRSHDDHQDRVEVARERTEERILTLEEAITSAAKKEAVMDSDARRASVADAASMDSVVERLRAEVTTSENTTKQRLSSVEQRLIRQEAHSREKAVELEQMLQRKNATMEGRVNEVEARLLGVEEGQSESNSTLQRLTVELNSKVSILSEATNAKILAVETLLAEQQEAHAIVAPLQGASVTTNHTEREQPSSSDNVKATRKTKNKSTKAAAVSLDSPEDHADLSRISYMSLSPVNKRSPSADLLEQRCELTLRSRSEADVDREDQLEEGAYAGESDEDDQVAQADFQRTMKGVNFDIATLGSRLTAFQPSEDGHKHSEVNSRLLGSSSKGGTDTREAAVESLQLKKIRHRRKFQKALFET